MSVGFIMLVHEPLQRARQVARHWAAAGCPIMIHVDKAVPRPVFEAFRRDMEDLPQIRFSARHRCEWGTFSLVDATQTAAEELLSACPDLQHVYLASGACLPLRPVDELRSFLAKHHDSDFIESVTTTDVPWTIGGLDSERFDFSFPFSWKRQRYLFDRWVRLQRLLGRKRPIPDGLDPHLGSQWWCLTRRTLEAILGDRRRGTFERYFRRVWIPDESYFQTLTRLHARKIESRSLTLSKFDFQGKPHIFYDDHLQLLHRSDCFVARKIWPRANRLYDSFLSPNPFEENAAPPNAGQIDQIFARAVDRRTRGRPGLYMQSRFPNWDWENGKTAAPYGILSGFGDLCEAFPDWLARTTGCRAHGHLFAPERAEFAGDLTTFAGGLSSDPRLRDYNPEAFLANLIWNTRGERQSFLYGARDTQKIQRFICADPNAHIALVTGAWAIPLFRSGRPLGDIRAEAARLQKIEATFLKRLRAPYTRARARIWTMAEFLENPAEPLLTVAADLGGKLRPPLAEMPHLQNLEGFDSFVQALRNEGMHPHLMGELPAVERSDTALPARYGAQRTTR
ncbi:MAG: beta-1,6-N-acetylglucosaminyltransferase [Pseudomonadota bacterium]